MNKFEKQFSKKLNEEVNMVEIKTNSQSILNNYHFEAKEKIPFYKKLSFKILAPLSFATVVGLSVVTPILLNKSNNNVPLKGKQLDNACYEIFAGLSYISSNQNTTKTARLAYRSTEQNYFFEMSDYFYTYYGLLDEINDYKNNEEKYISIESDDKEYPFCILINNEYKIYYQKETETNEGKTINGYVLKNNQKYVLKINEEHEIEDNEEEHEKTITIYYSNNDYVKIEKEYEIEGNKEEYSYSIKEIKDNNPFNDISFELENDSKELEIKYHKGKEIEYEYDYKYISNNELTINYDGIEKFKNVNYDISTNTFTYNSCSHIGVKK